MLWCPAMVAMPGAVSLYGTEHPAPQPGWKAPAAAEQLGCRAPAPAEPVRTGRSMRRGSALAVPPSSLALKPRLPEELILARCAWQHTEHHSFPSLVHSRTDTRTELGLTCASVSPHSIWCGKSVLHQCLEGGYEGGPVLGLAAPQCRRALPRVMGLYKPRLDGAQAQALLPDSHPEMPREQPRLGYCSTSLLPSPAKEKQQQKHLTSPLPALVLLAAAGSWRGLETGTGRNGIPAFAFWSGAGHQAGWCQPGPCAWRRGSLAAWCQQHLGVLGTGAVPNPLAYPAAAIPPVQQAVLVPPSHPCLAPLKPLNSVWHLSAG